MIYILLNIEVTCKFQKNYVMKFILLKYLNSLLNSNTNGQYSVLRSTIDFNT